MEYAGGGPILSVGGRPVGAAAPVSFPTRMAASVVGPSAHMRAVMDLPGRQFHDWEAAAYGCATIYNKVLRADRVGGKELFMPHSFSEDHGTEIPILIDHDAEHLAGWCSLEDRADGLYFRGQIRRGQLRKIGNARAVSLGFLTVAALPLRGVTRRYKCRAVELSISAEGCHSPYAQISIVGVGTLAAVA